MYRYKYGYMYSMPTSTLDAGCGYRPTLTFGTYAVALTTRHPSHIIGKFTGKLAAGRFSSEGCLPAALANFAWCKPPHPLVAVSKKKGRSVGFIHDAWMVNRSGGPTNGGSYRDY